MGDKRHPPKPPQKKEKGDKVVIQTRLSGLTSTVTCPAQGAKARLKQLRRNGYEIVE